MESKKIFSNTDKISNLTIRRLSVYLRALELLENEGVEFTSSKALGNLEGINPNQVRKDLSYFGSFGIRGKGYHVPSLRDHITKILGLNRVWNIALIGAGQFSMVFMNSEAFERKKLGIKKIFDGTKELVGKNIKGVPILDIKNLEKELDSREIDLVIVAVPPHEVQSIVDRLGRIGVRGILYFASRSVNYPENMFVLNQDVSIELGILTYRLSQSNFFGSLS